MRPISCTLYPLFAAGHYGHLWNFIKSLTFALAVRGNHFFNWGECTQSSYRLASYAYSKRRRQCRAYSHRAKRTGVKLFSDSHSVVHQTSGCLSFQTEACSEGTHTQHQTMPCHMTRSRAPPPTHQPSPLISPPPPQKKWYSDVFLTIIFYFIG